jgi:hypothetical protein
MMLVFTNTDQVFLADLLLNRILEADRHFGKYRHPRKL